MRHVPTGARGGLLVVKAGDAFLCATPDGDIPAGAAAGEGFYSGDTRVLSECVLTVAGEKPVLLGGSVDTSFRAAVVATNPDLTDADGIAVPRETLAIRRSLVVDGCLHIAVTFESFLPHPVRLPVELALAADFADVFDVRGVVRRPDRPRPRRAAPRDGAVVFAYRGADGVARETVIESDGELGGGDGDGAAVQWGLELGPHTAREIRVTVVPAVDGLRPRVRALAEARRALEQEAAAWTGACTRVRIGDAVAQRVIDVSTADLHALLTPSAGVPVPSAGIPWYAVPFGRDSLITAYACLMLVPEMARDTLRVLAHWQAREDDPARDAEPGKILHELRSGEVAGAGLFPTPYYGTADATPLFLMLVAEYWRWTGDLETVAALGPAIDRALGWIDHHGDRDGDLFVEYARRAPAGLPNQGWKDSPESTVHADGSRASGPIALVEVQAYVYAAKRGIADVLAALGDPARGDALRAEARELRDAFHEAFWNPREDTLALALDGDKRQVASVTSNPGHCLFTGILEPERAARVAERLMAGDMWSGWGVRTLSTENPAYNPMSYHNGSIWPHDNAIIAAGLRRYGHDAAAGRITSATFAIAAGERDHRIAELYCGFARTAGEAIVPYPVACSPQAWAAAAPFMLLGASLGLRPDAPGGALALSRPQPPLEAERVALEGLRVGSARVACVITPTGAEIEVTDGELSVTVEAAPGGVTPR